MMPGSLSVPVRGAFIVLEGCDRVGKSSHSAMLLDALKKAGIEAVGMRFPDRTTPSGQMISDYLTKSSELSDNSIHLLFAANRWEVKDHITKLLLENRTTIVADRYAASGAAFSSAKGLSLDWCCCADAGLPLPDLTVYLRTQSPADLLASRPGFGEERYETANFQSKVAAQFEHLYKLDQRSSKPTWIGIDASLSLPESQPIIQKAVMDTIENIKPEIRTLWPHLSIAP